MFPTLRTGVVDQQTDLEGPGKRDTGLAPEHVEGADLKR